jgi:serine/arginine repetitive matrix protein 2
MRLSSPPPNQASGRGSSLGPRVNNTPPKRNGQRNTSLSSVQELTALERPGSRGSVNFSYPTSSRPMSPVDQRRLTSPAPLRTNTARIASSTNQDLVYDPNTRSFLPRAEILAIEQRIRDVANQSVKKKKRIAPAQATRSHLAEGTVGGRPHGTAVDAMQAAARATRLQELPAISTVPATISKPAPVELSAPPTSTITSNITLHTAPRKKKKKVVITNDSDSDQASYIRNDSDSDSDFRPATFNTRTGAMIAKKPSIVREDREGEEEEETLHAADFQSPLTLDTRTHTVSPTPLPRSTAGRGHGRAQASASAAYAEDRQHTRSASQPAPEYSDATTSIATGLKAKDGVRSDRVQSVSPARTTHFATTPDSLIVKHQPPPRSISPRKSALKYHSNSPRGSSPAGEMPGAFGNSNRWSVSEASNASDELPVSKKKTVRVSFDESNVVVGEAAPPFTPDSPVAPSPQQTKRNWFSIGRGKNMDATVIEGDDDEIMKPRPALPSFGSVRERKNPRETVEERPLVKPTEHIESVEPVITADAEIPVVNSMDSPASPLVTNASVETVQYSMGQSNDHVVGAIISQDAATKNEANISKSREPLPPQVLSVEGSGYNSDTDSTMSGVDTERVSDVVQSDNTYNSEVEQTQDDKVSDENEDVGTPKTNGDIPQIAISQPTPTLEDVEKRGKWPDMPGGFPDGSSSSDTGSQRDEIAPIIAEHRGTDLTLAAAGIAEPYEGAQPGSPTLGTIAAENHLRDDTIAEETEDESVYSDAAEDLSDMEGDGFLSLDAVVESPVTNNYTPGLAISTPPDSPTARSTKEKAYKKSQLSQEPSEPETEQDWEKAQSYWRELSADKKLQLEREAQEDAESSDSTIEAKSAPKPKKKRNKPAAISTPPRNNAEQQIATPVRNGRTYMIQPGSKAEGNSYHPALRSSMRQEPQADSHIRKSMRGEGAMRGSLRESEKVDTKGSLQKKHRPISLPASNTKPDPVAVSRHFRGLSAASVAAAPAAAKRDMAPPVPTLRHKNSGDSDSSFKRTRPTGSSHFKSSMRRGSNDQPVDTRQQSPMGSGRFSLRSLSPTGSTAARRPFSSNAQPPTQTHMRNSMRSSYDTAPTMRGPKPSRAKSPLRIPGFGRSSSAKAPPQKPARHQASRFADSSDEEDARPSFRSRFVDSSDDDDEEPLPQSGGDGGGMRTSLRANQPIRGIPRRAGVADGDSSDLPDSDDERSPISPGKLAKVRPNGSASTHQGVALASGSLQRSGSGRGALISPITDATTRPQQARRGSFMSILRRKKVDPASKVRKADIESAARRDTPLERSRFDLQAVRRSESYQNGVRATSPKLQKKVNGAPWPLADLEAPPKIGGEDGRPFSADAEGTNGNGETGRPDLGSRRFTATGLADGDLNAVAGKERKKKKFQALRNLFGLND